MRPRCSMLGFGLGLMLTVPSGIAAEPAGPESSTNSGPDSTWLWQRWTRDHGLPDNEVTGVLQSRDGCLWAAMPAALARFDGRSWRVFSRADAPEMFSGRLRTMVEDVDGLLWVGSQTGLSMGDGRPFAPCVLRAEGEAIGPVCSSPSGGVWVAAASGLWRVQRGEKRIVELPLELIQRPLGSLREANGRLWIGHVFGVASLDPLTGTFDHGPPKPRDVLRAIRGLEWDDRDRLWVLSEAGSSSSAWLAPYDNGGWFTNQTLEVHNDARSMFLFRDRDGVVWFPSGRGRISFLREGRRMDVALPTPDFVLAMGADAEGGLWIGTESGGLLRGRPSRVQTVSSAHGLPQDSVWALCEARDGSVWIGTDSGVARLRDGRVTRFTQAEGLSRDTVRAIAEDADGRIWIGTGSGLNWVEEGRLRRHHFDGEWFSSKIRALLPARDRALWVGTTKGLHRLQLRPPAPPGRGDSAAAGEATPFEATVSYGETNGLPGDDVRALLEDRAGTLWVGTLGGGLRRWNHGTFEACGEELAGLTIWALHEDAQGGLWLATDRGLARWKEDRARLFTTREGMPEDALNHVIEDDHGQLWLGGERGIYRLARRELEDLAAGRASRVRPIAYGEIDGLPTRETNGQRNQPGAIKTRDGRLWFSTARGAAVLDTAHLPDPTNAPPVILEQIRAGGETIFEYQPGPPQVTSGFALPPGAGRIIEIHYNAVTFVAADKLRFEHRLEGLDRDWRDAGTRRVAQYANLEPGRYRFQVRAVNPYGAWNETGAAFAFTLAPFYWQTTWFKILAILVPLLAGYGYYRRRIAQHRRRADSERLAAVSAERADIARDLHDHLGVRLTLVQHLSQTLEPTAATAGAGEAATQKLADLARELNASLDSAVWAVQPDKDTLASLADYLGDTFHGLLDGTGIGLDLDFPETLPAWSLSRTERYHLALIAVEALNNSLKHGKPTLVRLRLETGDGAFQFHISDDGRGFDPGTPTPPAAGSSRRGGNGLANMRRRMEALGGRCHVTSAPGRGTTLTLTLAPAALRRHTAEENRDSNP